MKYLALVVLAGCASVFVPHTPKVSTHRDTVDGRTITTLRDVELRVVAPKDVRVFLGVNKVVTGATGYALVVLVMAQDWIYIESGESLRVLADGKRLAFTVGSEAIRSDTTGVFTYETATYPANREQVVALADSSSATMKIVGQYGYVEVRLEGKSLAALRAFVDAHVR